MAQIFISYSRRDLAFVKQLAADLQAAGLDVWYDLSGLEGGQRWRIEIEKALQESQYVIIVLSPDSVASTWVEEEILYARKLKLKIVPLFYKPCDLPLGFQTLHFIDIQGSKYPQNYKEILRALDIKRSDRENAEKTVLAKYEEVAAREKAEKEAAEKAEREAAEKAAREKAEREAAEKAAREKAEKEAAEKAAREKEEKEAAEKAAREKAEKEAAEKAAREKAAQEAAKKAKRDKEKQKITQKPEQSKDQAPRSSNSQAIFWIIGAIGIVLVIVLLSLNDNGTSSSPIPTQTRTSYPTGTSTLTALSPTETVTPTTRATSTPAIIYSPTPLGGGPQKVAFMSGRDNNIYVSNLTTVEPIMVVESYYYGIDWSPGGDKIALCDREGVYIVDANGSNFTTILEPSVTADYPGCDFELSWSPNGELLVFDSRRSGNTEIYSIEVNKPHNLKNLSNNSRNDDSPQWSPDGTKIAFRSYRSGSQQLYVMNADGTNPILLSNIPANPPDPNIQFAWSPDSQMIIFSETIYSSNEGTIIDLDGNIIKKITFDYYIDALFWSSDGTAIGFISSPQLFVEDFYLTYLKDLSSIKIASIPNMSKRIALSP